jgi:hypothetical protein
MFFIFATGLKATLTLTLRRAAQNTGGVCATVTGRGTVLQSAPLTRVSPRGPQPRPHTPRADRATRRYFSSFNSIQ